VAPTDTVWDLKRKYEAFEGTSANDQHFYFNTVGIFDHQTLGDCGVENDSLLHVRSAFAER
jgi:hypothetical protein